MKKVFLAIICLFLLTTETYADVSINETNFPDSIFRAYVSENFDKNNDDNLSIEEIAAVTDILIPIKSDCASLKGIEYFTSLKKLWCNSNKITYIDLSKNTMLEILGCDYTSIVTLDTSRNTALRTLQCGYTPLTKLNLTKNTFLDGLFVSGNKLKELDVSRNTSLTHLDCDDNLLEKLDVSNNTSLVQLKCNNNRLTCLNLANNSILDIKWISNQKSYKLKVNEVNGAFQVDLTNYVSENDLINIKAESIKGYVRNENSDGADYYSEIYPNKYNAATGILEFGIYPNKISYNYQTHSFYTDPNPKYNFYDNALMDVSIEEPYTEDEDNDIEDNTDVVKLEVDVLEHGRNDGLYSADGSGYTLYNAVSNDNAYLDYKGEIVTEAKIAAINDKAYIKEGFTADGNTRLILRIQSSKPGYVSFDVPIALGARLETLEGRKELTSNSLLTTTQVINYVNPYASPNNQATAVLIAPKDYPSSMNFPSDTFDVKVRFSDGSNIAEMSIPLEIHATPVVLIHGLWGNGLANFGLQNKTGIHTKLKDAGFSVTYWDYDGTLGPTDVIKNIKNPLYSHIASVRKKMNRKRIACTRVDFVCHSMGGLMARQYARSDLDTGNRSMHSYMSDSIRRIVTVATPHDGSPIANYLLEDFDELGLDRVDPFFAEVFKFARGAVKELVGKLNEDATAAFTDLAVNSKLLNELGYPKSVPMYSIYGTIKNHLEPLKETINGFADVANNVADAVVVYELVSGKYIWSHKSRLLLTGAVLIKCLAPNVSDIVESILSDIIFDGDDYDIAVPKSSALAHDKFLANSQLYDGWDDQHCYNHMEICVQDDVGDYVVELLKGSEDKFKIFGESGKSSSTANKKSVVTISDTSDTAEAVLKERFKMSVTPSVISVSETETGETTLKATTQGEIAESVYVLLNGDRIFSLDSNDGGNTFETKLLFGSRDVGIYNVLCLSPSSESSKDILISNIAQIVVKPTLSNVVSIGFPNELDSIATNVGAKINLGLCATTTNGQIYDISSPLMGTEWTSDDIAFVTDRGEVKGLKEGVTILKATYQGLTASISVDVGASYFDDNKTTPQDDDKEAQEQLNNELNDTLNSSGAGCNGICYGVLACSLVLLFFNNKKKILDR